MKKMKATEENESLFNQIVELVMDPRMALLTKGRKNSGGPEHLSHQGGDVQKTSHPLAEFVLKGVQHSDVPSAAHRLGEQQAAWWEELELLINNNVRFTNKY